MNRGSPREDDLKTHGPELALVPRHVKKNLLDELVTKGWIVHVDFVQTPQKAV